MFQSDMSKDFTHMNNSCTKLIENVHTHMCLDVCVCVPVTLFIFGISKAQKRVKHNKGKTLKTRYDKLEETVAKSSVFL